MFDVAGVFGIGADTAPPIFSIIGGVVLGLITLITLPKAWGGSRGGLNAAVV
ncbi:MAG: hypothetical protein ABR540_19300 [Acidimicrobiales bacterium]